MTNSVRNYSLGPFIKCPHPEIIEVCGIAGFDFVVVDMEHTIVEKKDLYFIKLAADVRNIKLIVRVPEISEPYIKWCLDLGIRYIQMPFVQTKKDAEEAVRLSFFNPIGERGLCRFVRSADFSRILVKDYLKISNDEINIIAQIEGVTGINNLEEILSVDNISSIFIGPYDLSQSLGVPGDIWNDKVISEMKKIILLCKKNKVKLGTFTDTPDGVKFWSNMGVDFIQYSSDLNLFMNGINGLFNDVME